MTTPAIAYTGPAVEASVPFEVRRHLQLIYQKLGNHTQAFALQQAKINAIKSGTSTTIEEGGSGGGFVIPATSTLLAVNNQSGVTSYATVSGDDGALITLSDASPIAVSLTPQSPPWGVFFVNLGAGTATLTPAAIGTATPTISYPGNPGASSMPIASGGSATVAFDGTNWWAELTAASAASGVSQITAGANVTISPIGGTGNVTINAATGLPVNNPTFTGTMTGPQIVANSSAPTVTVGSAAGTGASVSGVIGTDAGGSFTLTTGTGTSTGVLCTVTFANAYPTGAFGIVQGQNGASLATIFVGGISAGSLSVSALPALTASSSYVITYLVSGY